jgi:7-cyano-7-deazaguanine reductase
MSDAAHSPLGKPVAYASRYDPGLLFPIARAPNRAALGFAPGDALPFHGTDIWNAYELAWLDARGKPAIALAEFRVPAASPNLVESKSFKLYLNSFNQERVSGPDELHARLTRDLAAATGAEVAVTLAGAAQFDALRFEPLRGESLDALEIDIDDYGPPNAQYLCAATGTLVEETLASDLLKSNCPVTGQPDWASVQIAYAGRRIDRAGLLRYLVSYREHAGFHEQCVERIFLDLSRQCAPDRLSVHARYTRRGGLDINPWRSSMPGSPPNPRGPRQ